MKLKVIASVILAGLALVFIFQNVTIVNIRFLFWTLEISRSLLMVSFFVTGLLAGWLLHSYSMQRKQKARA
jgi:uncharacterized integral membrane protein